METAAFFRHFVDKCEHACGVTSVTDLHDIADSYIFASRLSGWFEGYDLPPATNILTILRKIDKEFAGIYHHYEILSEVCHPNYLGSFSAFGSIDFETARVDYSISKLFNKSMLSHVTGGMLLIGMIEIDAERLTKLIPKVADLQAGEGEKRR